jgi:hypothetical protein
MEKTTWRIIMRCRTCVHRIDDRICLYDSDGFVDLDGGEISPQRIPWFYYWIYSYCWDYKAIEGMLTFDLIRKKISSLGKKELNGEE